MGTAKIDWDASWSADSTIGGTHNDGAAADQSAEYTTDGSMQFEFSANGTYATGTYDQPAFLFVLRKAQAASTYQEQKNAYMRIPLNGGSAESFNVVFTVGPDINSFIIEIDNDSNLNITSFNLHYKKSHVLTAA